VFTAGQCLSLLPPAGVGDPPPVVAGMAALCVLTAWWAHRWLLREGRAARPRILRAGIGLAIVLTVAGAVFGRRALSPNGATVYVGVGLILLGYLIGLYWFGLTRRQVLEAAGGTAACLVAAAAFARGPYQGRTFIAIAIANLVTFATCRRISIALSRAGEEYAGEARAEDRARVEAAFRQGRASVLDLACEARDDALRQLHQVQREIDPALAALVSGRLEEVDRRLRTLHTGSALSSSTTMS
jgi:hypothetical protein